MNAPLPDPRASLRIRYPQPLRIEPMDEPGTDRVIVALSAAMFVLGGFLIAIAVLDRFGLMEWVGRL